MRLRHFASIWICIFIWINSISLLADTASVTVNYSVSAIDAISLSGDPSTLTINSATAGSPPNSATNTTTTYSITTNGTARRITALVTGLSAGYSGEFLYITM